MKSTVSFLSDMMWSNVIQHGSYLFELNTVWCLSNVIPYDNRSNFSDLM